jgi:hypothetical protein
MNKLSDFISENASIIGRAFVALVPLAMLVLMPFTAVDFGTGQWMMQVYMFSILITVIAMGLYQAHKKKMTFVDYFTLQAKDEREQQLIDSAGRKTYASVRIAVTAVGLLAAGGVFRKNTFSVQDILWFTLFIIFAGEAFFAFFTKKIGTKK